MQNVVAIGAAGSLDLGQHFVFAAEGRIDNLVAGSLFVGHECILAQSLADHSAPTFEIELLAGGHRRRTHGRHETARNTGRNTGATEQLHEFAAIDIAVAGGFAQFFVTYCIV